ncbi:unnamed protein product, partial [Aureobasidium pullulans]
NIKSRYLDAVTLGGGSAQQDYGSSFGGFLASIQIGAFIALIQIGGFIILRRREKGSLRTSLHDLESSCIDAIGLFALLRFLTILFGITAVIGLPILVPLNYIHHHSGTSARGLDKFSCLNILEDSTQRLWAHLVAAYCFTCLLPGCKRELEKFVILKRSHKQTEYLYLVTDIPRGSAKREIESMFRNLCTSDIVLYATPCVKLPHLDDRSWTKAASRMERELTQSSNTGGRIAVLEIGAASLTSNILPQKIWPLHAYPLGKNLDCVNWNNARRSRTSRTAINIFMAILSFALSCIFALPVTFSASLSQIQDLTKNISWLHWVSRVPPRALEYIQGAAPQLFVGIVVALVPSILIYLSSWHCHVTSAKVEIAYYRYYSAFLFLQAFLLVGLSSSLVVTLSEVLTQPSAIPRVLALNLPKAGNYFISFLTLQGFSLFADLVAQWRWLSVKAFENWMATPTPRHIACLNSRDPFSLTSMYSTVMLLGVIVYSIMTPLALIPSAIGIFALLIAIKPALCHFKDDSTSTGGEIFFNVVNQLFLGLYMMHLCLTGIFISTERKTEKFTSTIQAALTLL